MDGPQERGERVSRRGHRYRSDELSDRSRILLIDLQRRDLHIDERGLDLRMSHQLHEGCRHQPACTDEVDGPRSHFNHHDLRAYFSP